MMLTSNDELSLAAVSVAAGRRRLERVARKVLEREDAVTDLLRRAAAADEDGAAAWREASEVATGVLIAVVLAVMTGTTVHVSQGLGWAPTTPAGFVLPLWANSWLGLYATWECLGAQAGAIAVVLGSYVVARELQVRRPRRRGLRAG